MRLNDLRPFRPILRDWATIAAVFRSGGAGASGAWGAMRDWARHRSLTVTTRADPAVDPVLLTRIQLNGAVQTKIDRAWLNASESGPASALAKSHFQAVRAALAGWPAVLALTRELSWITGVILGGVALRDFVTTSYQEMLPFLLSWRFWLPVLPLAVGTCVRLTIRLWLRRRLRSGAR